MLSWYRQHHRRLPWRAPPGELGDPYRVLVSEAMLQQTQVATVVAYYRRFVRRWATVHALARAREQDVLRLWQGLGYYRRARHLQAAARMIVAEFDGQVPAAIGDLLQLPGVGRYTAGAIASIAHGREAPILDGNVARVLARWFAIDAPIDAATTIRQLWLLAEQLVPRSNPGDFNQAMMELGAMVCTPTSPSCLICPARSHCQANKADMVDRLPVRSTRPKVVPVEHHVVAVARRGEFLFEQRDGTGLWASMWQMPTWEQAPASDGRSPRIGPKRISHWLEQHTGLHVGSVKRIARFNHKTTHRAITFVVWRVDDCHGRLNRSTRIAREWRRLDAINDLPLAKPQQRVVSVFIKTT